MSYKLGQRVRRRPSKIVRSGGLLLGGFLLFSMIMLSHISSKTVVPKKGKDLSATSAHKQSGTKNKTSVKHDDDISTLHNLRAIPCTSLFPPRNTSLANASSPELVKLAQYEQVCNGTVFERSSFFAPTPTTTAEAKDYASDTATKLREYSQMGVKPLVFLEPTTTNGDIDLNSYRSGRYDSALNSYFYGLKSNGITDAMMGMWVIMPEGNIPVWSSVDPSTFVANVTKTISFQKKYFPASQSSVMLDGQTYPSSNSWEDGAYKSLLPYVQSIPKGLVDSFGLQGFPWAPRVGQSGDKAYDPAIYLHSGLASEAATALGVRNVWFNTGTFSRMYTDSPAQTVMAQPIERQAMLDGVIAQAKSLEDQGFNVSIHLFAEDKSTTSEATDWSYWRSVPANDANAVVFTTFVHDAAEAHLSLWLYDSSEH